MTPSIGIKIANGEFYPVLEEGSAERKRLILTTVHDGQRSVQIDLYRSESRSMVDAAYIGSLVVENIAEKPKGEPSIELAIGSDNPDELSAEAYDSDDTSPETRQTLSVSLKALNEADASEIPDFELENDVATIPPAGLYEEPEEEAAQPERPRLPIPQIAVAVLAILLFGAATVWLFVFNERKPEQEPANAVSRIEPAAVPAAPTPAPQPEAKAETTVPAVPTQSPASAIALPVSPSEAAARRARPSAPVKSYKVPKTIPKEGFRYRIRWGDTLWDISEAFYRNPWLYPRIARFNKIRNPDFILSGAYIRIPPKK